MRAKVLIKELFAELLDKLIESELTSETKDRLLFDRTNELERYEQQIRALEMQVMREDKE